MHGEELRLLAHFSDGGAHLTELDAGRDRAQQYAAALRPLRVERHVQIQPGLERLDHGALAALLGGDALDARVVALNGLGGLERAGQPRIVQQDTILQLGLGREQLALFRRIAVEQFDRVDKGRVLAPERGNVGVLTAEQPLDLTALELAVHFGELHTAVADQLLEQLLLAVADSEQPEFFHF